MGGEGCETNARVRLLSGASRPAAVEALALAFRDNPLNCAVIQDSAERRLRSNRVGIRATLEAAEGHSLLLGAVPAAAEHEDDVVQGVLLAAAPHGFPLPSPSLWSQLLCLVAQGRHTVQRWSEVYSALEAVHPQKPHWYLCMLGVDPPFQRTGLGGALLRSFVERVDEEPAPSYLETDRAENVAFYGQQGFEVVRELEILEVPVWCMRRRAL